MREVERGRGRKRKREGEGGRERDIIPLYTTMTSFYTSILHHWDSRSCGKSVRTHTHTHTHIYIHTPHAKEITTQDCLHLRQVEEELLTFRSMLINGKNHHHRLHVTSRPQKQINK